LFFSPDLDLFVAEVALHEDVIEADDEAHQHEHLNHLDGGRGLEASRGAQVPVELEFYVETFTKVP
jgi:hypothetical protein